MYHVTWSNWYIDIELIGLVEYLKEKNGQGQNDT